MYPRFDFTWMGDQHTWPTWQDSLVDDNIKHLVESEQKDGFRYLRALDIVFPQPLEHRDLCYRRSMEAVGTIKDICRRRGFHRVLVVSHNRILKYVSGREDKGRVPGLANCEVRLTYI